MSIRKGNSGSPPSSIGKDDLGDFKTPVDVADEAQLDIPGETAMVVDHAAERALCRKIDYRLLPVLAVMYLFNALDKGNLGNAKTAHMDTDLGFHGNQYNIILSVFYVPYVLCAPPIVGSASSISRVSLTK
jgi:hypothetical protein